MTRRFINQLKENESISEVYQIFDKQLRPNKNGNLYLQFVLADRTGSINGRIWNVTAETYQNIENGFYVQAEGAIQRFQGALQFIGRKLTPVDSASIDSTLFVRVQSIDVSSLKTKLSELFKTLKNPMLRNLADCFLLDEEFMNRFYQSPAGIKLHHAYLGGLLEHTVTMMSAAERIAPLYPTLDKDLLVFGAFLHDIGKTEELSFGTETLYTDSGQLLGHSFMGTELLIAKINSAEKLSGEPFDPELAMMLKHFLISHHGILENGAARLPMTREAFALYVLDVLDSKLAEFQKYILDDPNIDGQWTNYIPAIDRKLYKSK